MTRGAALAVAAGALVAASLAAWGPSGGDGLRFTRAQVSVFDADSASSPSASWADVEGDGDLDLLVLNGFATLRQARTPQPDVLYRNDGTGGFTAVRDHPVLAEPTFSGSGVWGDYDEDGDLDLFVAVQQGADNRLYQKGSGGSYARVREGAAVSDGGRSFSASWVDIDGDGLLDLHVLNGRDGDGGQRDFVYRNRGGGRLERVSGLAFAEEALPSGGAAWADYDGDGDLDLFLPVHASGPSSRLYRNEGDWSFTEVTAAAGVTPGPFPVFPTTSVALWVDYDNDADLDLFVGTTGGRADLLYRNDGTGRFERATAGRVGLDATYVSDATWADLDNDADQDLVIAVWGGASEIYLNDGGGRLRPARGGDFGGVVNFASSVSAADVEGDGDLDLFLTQWPINRAGGLPNQFYRNDGAEGHWLEVDLEGTASNRAGLGARITVTATIGGEAVTQLRHVASRTSWRSAGPLSRHFGLAGADSVDRVVVRWPSGAADTIEGPIAADRRLEVVEGRGRAGG